MSPLSFIFIDGQFIRKQSTIAALSPAIQFRCDAKQIYLHIPKQLEISSPMQFVFLGKEDYSLARTIIIEENSHINIFDEYAANAVNPYITNIKTQIILRKNSKLDFYQLQKESVHATHLANVCVEQEEGSALQVFTLDAGGKEAHHTWHVDLKEKHAACNLTGLYVLNQDEQTVNHHIHMDHQAPFGKSGMFYKGILDQKSRAYFKGRVKAHEKAHRIQALQENHHLLLSNFAEAKSEPELEIYAEDIQCKHGATVGQLDNEALFYLTARGIDENTAKQMLVDAFGMDVLNKIPDNTIREYMQREVFAS